MAVRKSILIFGGLGTRKNYFQPLVEILNQYDVKVIDIHNFNMYDVMGKHYDLIIGFSSSCAMVSHMFHHEKNNNKVLLVDPPCCSKIRELKVFKSAFANCLFWFTGLNLFCRRLFLFIYRYFGCSTTPYCVDDAIFSMGISELRAFLKRFVLDYECFDLKNDMVVLTNYGLTVNNYCDWGGGGCVKLNTCHHFMHWKPYLMKGIIDRMLLL